MYVHLTVRSLGDVNQALHARSAKSQTGPERLIERSQIAGADAAMCGNGGRARALCRVAHVHRAKLKASSNTPDFDRKVLSSISK